ncbi:MAG TPA: UDPGP type 1 family protein [Anaerolineae bacterium]|nr:UDPGP type 1 family protein [Anaerolineae bacterium]
MSEIKSSLRAALEGGLYERVLQAGQEHIFRWWPDLTDKERAALANQITHIDFDLQEGVVGKLLSAPKEDFSRLVPAQSTTLREAALLTAKTRGEQAIQNGEVCSLVLAGGQGTRLGYSFPKGMYPIGPVSGKSLFEWFAESIRFISQRFGAPNQIPWLIMTSEATDSDTRNFFQKKNYFGLRQERVYFFKQGMIPAIDFQGKLLMDTKYHICENPDGHGGVIKALGKSGLLDKLTQQGVQHIFLHNVDNCLAKICDPVFLGHHIAADADFSFKSLSKRSADETLGTIAYTGGKIKIIEYSDTPTEIASLKDEQGQLVYRNGSINTYLIRVSFMKQLFEQDRPLPFHYAWKKIPALDPSGNFYEPQEPNGIKLEKKIFDALQYTDKVTMVTANRTEEFSPLKNDEGSESYPSVIHDLQARFFAWLEHADFQLPAGKVERIEISPLFAIDADTFQEKVDIVGKIKFAKMIERQIEEEGWINL